MEKYRILVIDDKKVNLDKAEKQFAGKNVELETMPTYSSALYWIMNYRVDIVLTDLMLIGEGDGISRENPEIGKEVPYGFILAILAKNKGIEHVAIVTDISHHSGPIAWAVDEIMGSNKVISCFTKNWLKAAESFVPIVDAPADEQLVFHKPTIMLAGFNDNYKRMIQAEIPKQFAVIFIEEEKSFAKTFGHFLSHKPEVTIIIGEIDPRAEDSNYDARKIFRDLKNLNKVDQKILVLGFMPWEDPDYLRLPITIEDILKKVDLL